MERHHFLKLAFGFAAGAAALAASAQAAPLAPHPLLEDGRLRAPKEEARPATPTARGVRFGTAGGGRRRRKRPARRSPPRRMSTASSPKRCAGAAAGTGDG